MASIPGWMNNTADFIRIVHQLSGNPNKEALKRKIAELKAEIDRMKPEPKAEPSFITSVELVPVFNGSVAHKTGKEIYIRSEPVIPLEKPNFDYEAAHLLTQLASLSQLTQIKEKLTKEEFEGKLDPRTLDATDKLQWLDLAEDPPHKPWITAYFINDGDTVEIGVNHPELGRHQIKKTETLTIDQSHASERINRLFYVCASGVTASLVRVVGQY